MKKTYNVFITFDDVVIYNVDVTAKDKNEARKKAKQKFAKAYFKESKLKVHPEDIKEI